MLTSTATTGDLAATLPLTLPRAPVDTLPGDRTRVQALRRALAIVESFGSLHRRAMRPVSVNARIHRCVYRHFCSLLLISRGRPATLPIPRPGVTRMGVPRARVTLSGYPDRVSLERVMP